MESSWDFLICGVCLVISESMSRYDCCKKLICDTCKEAPINTANCPFCKCERPHIFRDDIVITIIQNTSEECKTCMRKVLLKDYEEHKSQCKKMIKCKVCNIRMRAYEIQSHVYNKHYSKFEATFVDSENSDEAEDEKTNISDTNRQVRPERKYSDRETNGGGASAIKSSVNGKYYCGSKIQYENDHKLLPKTCGPEGLNCKHCMKLDLDSRGKQCLFLVNAAGREAEIDVGSYKFSCNIEIEEGKKSTCKGSKNCKECKQLTKILIDMENECPYHNLVFPKSILN